MAHNNIFNTDTNMVLLVNIWKINSTKALVFACVIVGVLALLYQGIKFLLNYMECEDICAQFCNRYRRRFCTGRHLLETLLHMVKVAGGYLLMLLVMSYNTWIFIAVVSGLTLGFFCYGWSIQDMPATGTERIVVSKSQAKSKANSKSRGSKGKTKQKGSRDRGPQNGHMMSMNPPHLLSRNVLYPGEHQGRFIALLDQDLDVTEV